MRNLICVLLLSSALGGSNPAFASADRVILKGSIAPTFVGGRPGKTGTVTRQELTVAEIAADQSVHFALKLRNFEELQARIRHGEVLSLADMSARYLPVHETWQEVATWAKSQGFSVKDEDLSRMTVSCSASVASVQSALRTTFARVVGTDGHEYTSAITPPSVPLELSDSIVSVCGIQPHLKPMPRQTITPTEVVGPYLSPKTFAQIYNADGLGVDGTGETIVILGGSKVNPTDLSTFWRNCGLPTTLAQFTEVDPFTPNSNDLASEETMDIEWASAMAPGAKIVYFSSIDPGTLTTWLFAQLPVNHTIHQVNISWCLSEADYGTYIPSSSQYFAAMTAVGVTIFSSSGDWGSADGDIDYYSPTARNAPEYPASDPYVTGVGGTNILFTWDNDTLGPVLPYTEGGWCLPTDQPLSADTDYDASGGGVSLFFSRQPWQLGNGLPSGNMRCVPDVAAVSVCPGFPPYYYFWSETQGASGTSLSSPIWTGLCALMNQARAKAGFPSLGLLGPKIYPLMGTSAFNQITTGANGAEGFTTTATNGAYMVGPNYNMVTGLGSPNVGNLIVALTVAATGAAPSVTTQPTPQSAFQGGTAMFTVAASGTPLPTYQWTINGTALLDGLQSDGSIVSGSATNSLTISNAQNGANAIVANAVNSNGVVVSNATTLTVNPTFTWYPAAITYGTPLSAAQLNATALVPGTFVYTPAAGTMLNVGTQTLSVTFTPTDAATYPTATAIRTVTVNQAVPVITWPPPAAINYGTALSLTQLCATANVPGTFVYMPATGAVLNAGTQTLAVTFTPTDTANYTTATANQTLVTNPPAPADWTPVYSSGQGLSTFTNGQQDFVVSSGSTQDMSGQLLTVVNPSYSSSWSVQVNAHLDTLDLSGAKFASLSLIAIRTADLGQSFGTSNVMSVAIDRHANGSSTTVRDFQSNLNTFQNGVANAISSPESLTAATDGTLRISFNSVSKKLTTSYSIDGADWITLQTVYIGGAAFNWGMKANDPFSIILMGSSGESGGTGPVLATGQAYFTNFLSATLAPVVSVTTLAGSRNAGSTDGPGSAASFSQPAGVAVDGAGNVYVADSFNNKIRIIDAIGAVTTLAGSGIAGLTNGTGTGASFNGPGGVAVDSDGNVYVADTYNLSVRKVSGTGAVTTLTSSGPIMNPNGVAVDDSFNVYGTGNSNSVWKVTSAGVVTTLAGSRSAGSIDAVGTGASFNYPTGVAIDAAGNVYVADAFNNRIREVSPAGVVTTLAGSGSAGSIDATGTGASFNNPAGVAVDGAGNVFVADQHNNRIRMVDPAGVVTTLAGTGDLGSTDGAGTAATFQYPKSVAVDGSGNVFVADQGSNEVRKITQTQQEIPLITWLTPAAISFDTALSATQMNATANVAGSFVYTPTVGSVLGAGTHTLSVTFTPTDTTRYTSAVAIQTLIVRNTAVPVITWPPPGAIAYGTALSATQLDATANVPGTFAYTPAAGTVLSAGSQTLSVTFTPTDIAEYTTATATQTLLVADPSDQAFLQGLFLDVLGRPIDSGALSAYLAAMSGGRTRAQVYGDLIASGEYAARQIEPVIRLYHAAFARTPDYPGLQNWCNALQTGVLTLTGAADQFADSAEFLLKYGSLDNAGYVQRLYRNVLGREADAPGLADWVGRLNGGATRGAILVGFSESPEFQADMANQVEIIRLYDLLMQRMPTDVELRNWLGFRQGDDQANTLFAQGYPSGMADSDYVSLVFQGFLRRPADAGALSTFGSALTAGTVTHGSLVDTLLTSTEFNTFVGPVSRLYMAAFHRVPDAGGLDNSVAYVRGGNTLRSAADAFVASPEFQLTYGSLNDTQYVTLLYENVLGREPDPTGLATWTGDLSSGWTGGQVLIGFSESQEGITLFAPTVRTFLHYFTFLNATPAHSDLNYWKNYLATLEDQMRETLLADMTIANGN